MFARVGSIARAIQRNADQGGASVPLFHLANLGTPHKDKKTMNTSDKVTFNGVAVIGVGVRPITRKGNLNTEVLGYGIALLTEKDNGRRNYRNLADLLKGCKDITGAAFQKYTEDAFTEARALNLALDFSKATGVPLQDEERAKIADLRKKADEMKKKAEGKGEEGDKGEEGKKAAKKAKKTTAEKIADIVNAIGGTIQARATPLIDALATLDPLAAAAAKCAIEGGTPEDVAALLEKARRAKGEAAAQAAKK